MLRFFSSTVTLDQALQSSLGRRTLHLLVKTPRDDCDGKELGAQMKMLDGSGISHSPFRSLNLLDFFLSLNTSAQNSERTVAWHVPNMLRTRHCPRCWGIHDEQVRHSPWLQFAGSLARNRANKYLIPMLPWISCVTLGKLLHLSGFPFSYCNLWFSTAPLGSLSGLSAGPPSTLTFHCCLCLCLPTSQLLSNSSLDHARPVKWLSSPQGSTRGPMGPITSPFLEICSLN